ncbi:MAG: hypothetical protein ACK5DD_00770 [Cyclobacteriaceae bacterium]|jgi:hypothetical protein
MRFSSFFAGFLSLLLVCSSAQPLFAQVFPAEIMEESVSTSEADEIQVSIRASRNLPATRFEPPRFGPEPVNLTLTGQRTFLLIFHCPLFLLHRHLTL